MLLRLMLLLVVLQGACAGEKKTSGTESPGSPESKPDSVPKTNSVAKAGPTSGPLTVESLAAYAPASVLGMARTEHGMKLEEQVLVVAGYALGDKSLSLNLSRIADLALAKQTHPYLGREGTVQKQGADYRGLMLEGFPAQRTYYTDSNSPKTSVACVVLHSIVEVCISVWPSANPDEAVLALKTLALVDLGRLAAPHGVPDPPPDKPIQAPPAERAVDL